MPDVPTYVEYGAADIGIVGKDTILEEGRKLYEVMDLGFGKCKMCVCGPESAREVLENNQLIRVATKYPNIAKDYFFNRKHQTVDLIKLNGSIELAPIVGLSEVIVDIVETGSTLKENGLKAAGKTVHLGGNIGCPLLPKVEEIRKDDVAVVELSSFQLISMRKSPDVAVVTNLAPNHLDIHKDMQEYIDAKKNIILHQNAFGRAVLNLDNEITRGLAPLVRGELSYFTRQHTTDRGVCLNGGAICHRRNGVVSRIMDVKDIRIPGNHNVENYMAAIAAVWGEVSPEQMHQVAESFPGVEHRAEFVRNVDGADYYNDSIASSPTRTISGTLSLYSQKIILIAGGYDKKIPYDAMGPVVNEKVKLLILMGNTADKIQSAVTKAENYDPQAIRIIRVENMEEAVETAHRLAQKGDVVSLSPASASFDLYPNFAARGNHFKQLVNAL